MVQSYFLVIEYIDDEHFLYIKDADAKAAAAGDERFRITPKVASIVGKPVLTTLYYCCLYHYGISEVRY